MFPQPRFRRVAALDRPFVDREAVLQEFAEALEGCGGTAGPRMLNVVGVGGIGKSRVLAELRQRCAALHVPAALVDLQAPPMRQPENALAVLRVELGRQGVSFDRFDIAYTVLWQRLHPHLPLNKKHLPFAEHSEVLSTILADAAGVPLVGTAMTLVKLARKAAARLAERRTVRLDDTLGRLDQLTTGDLQDAVTHYLAADIRDSDTACVVFADAYEALVPTGRLDLADADFWLRDLAAQLNSGLTVVAGREPVGWAAGDPRWAPLIRVHQLDGLPMTARLELLSGAGTREDAPARAMARASQGVPFYLHLALDTTSSTGGTEVVSHAEILARFLRHVPEAQVRILRLLSIARTFDYTGFRVLAQSFHLPHDRMVWEVLTGYSFVYPDQGSGFHLHQLMLDALRRQLSAGEGSEAHERLCAMWQQRSQVADERSVQGHALREAAYHGVRAGALSGEAVLDLADRARRSSGTQAADGIRADLEEYLAAASGPDLRAAAWCLEAEAAVLRGDAEWATAVTDPQRLPEAATVLGARLVIAAAHGRRIGGGTSAAAELYSRVWREHTGEARNTAGLWMADLHMAQGKFSDALQLTAEVFYACPPDALELRGDLARLTHLAHRFHVDFPAARSELSRARQLYERAGSAVGLANVAVNRVELLAWTDPAEALRAAPEAIAAQEELAALHELGKVHTALAVAHLHLDDDAAAAESFTLACDYLDRAGYRSGRARTELFRAFLHARRGSLLQARRSAVWAVQELQDAEVYPTLILTAQQLLHRLGPVSPLVDSATAQARTQIAPMDSIAALERRISDLVSGLLGPGRGAPWRELYEAARRAPAAAGFYNRNVRMESPEGPVNVRIPLGGAAEMDLRIWPEDGVLAAIAPHVARAPRLLHRSTSPRFTVQEFIEGRLCDEVCPRGVAVPSHLLSDVVALMVRLHGIEREELPSAPAGWPEGGDTAGVARRLSQLTAQVHARFVGDYAELYSALGVPAAPLEGVDMAWSGLESRPLGVVHADIHRKNIILAGGSCVFLDWELALWGDPVYELAVHIHKMGYQPNEREELVRRWRRAMPAPATADWQQDLHTYLRHERIKSAVVDTVRYSDLYAQSDISDPERERAI